MSNNDSASTVVDSVPEEDTEKSKPDQEQESTTKTKKVQRTDQNDLYSMRVKAEYVLTERPPSLGPLPTEESKEEKDSNGATGNTKSKKKGVNRKRPRDQRQDASEKMCLSVIRGSKCVFGDDCKFSHDMKAFMESRPTDIKEVEGGCPNFNVYGKCVYGAMCRFGESHINMSTGRNIDSKPVSETDEDDKVQDKTRILHPLAEKNLLPRDVQVQLRKKKYPFKCKRHFEKKEEPSSNKENGASSPPASTTPVELKTRKIIDFSNKVYIAPLTTVGNLPFRRIMKKFGADITCGEMALATQLLEGKASEWALLKRHPEEDVFGIQLAAAHPDQFTRASELIENYTTTDFVDLNLGCPLDLVCNKGAGAMLMKRENKLKGALIGITKTLSCPITIKMRTGWDINNPFAHKLVPKIQSWQIVGIGAIMIHGRSRLQRYQKDSNWDYIQQVANSQSSEIDRIPVIGNGDIFSYTDYQEKIAREGISATAMLGRGALIKPWLPQEIKEQRHWDISASERLDILKDFVRFGLEHWGSDQQGVNNTRRFLLEWLSFLHRYVPVGLLEVLPQQMNQRPPNHIVGRNDLETLMMSSHCADWIKLSEMLLGPVYDGFRFEPKHKARGYAS